MSVVGANGGRANNTEATEPVTAPPGWRVVFVDSIPVYISEKNHIAVLQRPKNKKKPRRTSRLSTESGTFVVQPHDETLPTEWERAVVVSPGGCKGAWIWHNVATGSTSLKDPRQTLFEDGNPLPAGFTLAYDDDGDVYFIDHNSGTTSYDDPRLMCTECLGTDAERIAERALRATNEEDTAEGDALQATAEAAAVAAVEAAAMEDVVTADDPTTVVANNGHVAAVAEPVEEPLLALPSPPEPTPWLLGRLNHYAFNTMPQYLTAKQALPAEVTSSVFNRYINILPNPATRVLLEDDYEPSSEASRYINANYVKSVDGKHTEYIAAMGPLETTIEAFWRMVWQVDAPAIVMTTPMMEQGVTKCARYWPTVKYNEEKRCGDKRWGDIRVAVISGIRKPGYIVTRLRLTKGASIRLINHYWFQEWPDHGVPGNEGAAHVVGMMREVHQSCLHHKGGPAIVHCSAGIGRTGTFIAIDHCIRELEENGSVEPLYVIENLRRARGGMVQHVQQYEFVHRACIEFAKSREQKLLQATNLSGPMPCEPRMEVTPPSSQRGKPGEWKQSVKSKKPQVLAALIVQGRPSDMPEEEWKKASRKYVKQQATIRAASSIRRKLDVAELHGELRLGTLSGGTNDGRYRPSVQQVFAAPHAS